MGSGRSSFEKQAYSSELLWPLLFVDQTMFCPLRLKCVHIPTQYRIILPLKFASYNIHRCIGLDRRRKPERVLDVLNEIDADIIALQEADFRFGKRDAVISTLLLSQRTDYQPLKLDVQHDSMGWHGNAILVRKSAVIAHNDMLHIPSLEPRGAVMAQFADAGVISMCSGCTWIYLACGEASKLLRLSH
jgi:exonuclease III